MSCPMRATGSTMASACLFSNTFVRLVIIYSPFIVLSCPFPPRATRGREDPFLSLAVGMCFVRRLSFHREHCRSFSSHGSLFCGPRCLEGFPQAPESTAPKGKIMSAKIQGLACGIDLAENLSDLRVTQ